MYGLELTKHFLDAADLWLCDDYAIDIRYIARKSGDIYLLWNAAITLGPLPHQSNESFRVEAAGIVAERRQFFPVAKAEALGLLGQAIRGQLTVGAIEMSLESVADLDYYSETNQRDQWYSPLHLRIGTRQVTAPTPREFVTIDGALRATTPPFDGLSDLASTLGLNANFIGSNSPAITVYVSPPVDILFDQTRLTTDRFTATLNAHPKLSKSRIGLFVRAAPLMGSEGRRQLASQIVWSEPTERRSTGTIQIELPRANSVLAVLVIGETTVRRQWFIDPARAGSQRYVAFNQSDPDLRQLRQALLDSADSFKFEQAVAAMVFLLGFAPALPLESNAPDIVASTPAGRQLVVECTLRIGDFSAKIGKLVDRRTALQKALATANLPSAVTAVLVCRLPRDQIAALPDDLASHKVILLSQEDLVAALDQVRYPTDPDQLLTNGLNRINERTSQLNA